MTNQQQFVCPFRVLGPMTHCRDGIPSTQGAVEFAKCRGWDSRNRTCKLLGGGK